MIETGQVFCTPKLTEIGSLPGGKTMAINLLSIN